jgi:hypothetical protein
VTTEQTTTPAATVSTTLKTTQTNTR